MDSLEGINAIPVPARNYNTGDPKKDCIYYVLQRKATEHKKNKRMDLAIACLKKSNELSDYEKHPPLTSKEYLRLIKYIELTGDFELAQSELAYIYSRHPEFLDRRVANLIRIKEMLAKNKRWKNDLVILSTNSSCPTCKKYDKEIYSISGKNKKYKKLPLEITKSGGFCPNCYISLNSYFEDVATPVRKKRN